MNNDLMFAKRLMLLANFLEKLPEGRFDYSRWVGNDWEGREDFSCGTTACAFGWAATLPELREAGLRAYKSGWENGFISTITLMEGINPSDVTYDFELVRKAGKEIFDLNTDEFEYLFIPRENQDSYEEYISQIESVDESDYLNPVQYLFNLDFSPGEYATSKEVSKHIRAFVNAKYPGVL